MVAIRNDAQKSDALVIGFVGACQALQTTASSLLLLYPKVASPQASKAGGCVSAWCTAAGSSDVQ